MKCVCRWGAAFLLAVATLRSSAAWMTPLSIEELRTTADVIVHGTVKSKACEQSPDGRIFTRVKLDFSEVWKGAINTNTFSIVHGGGTFGGITTMASIQVEFAAGEEIVAFLRLNDRGEGVVIGMVQGKFQVWRDKASGEKFVRNTFHGVAEAEAGKPEGKAAKLALRELATRAKGPKP